MFASWLKQVTQLPVALFDERFTTAEARQLLSETNMSGKKKRERTMNFGRTASWKRAVVTLKQGDSIDLM